MNRSKVIVGLLASFTLCIGLLAVGPAVGQAQAKKYSVWVAGKQVTSKNAGNVLGNGRVSYNASTKTLTLKNARLKGALLWKNGDTYRSDGIKAATGGTFTIKLVGTNSITVPYKSKATRSFGIDTLTPSSAMGLLAVKGTGKLTLKAARAKGYSAGILAGKVTVKGSAKLISKGSYATESSGSIKRGGYGIAAKNALRIQGKAKVTASGSTAAFYGHGFAMPTYGSGYTPKVKAGSSASAIKVNKKSPAKSVYAKYKYVAISKSSAAKTSKKPAKVSFTEVTSFAGGIDYDWKALTKRCTGYQIQLSTSSGFASGKTWTFTSSDKRLNHASIDNLSGGTTYYARIRGLNKSGSKTYYGAWSAVRSAVPSSAVAAG